jgi:hypothetical protein
MSQEKLSFLLSQNHNHCLLVLSVYVTLLCLFVCMSVCVFVCLSVCLNVYLSFKLTLFDFIIIIQVVFNSEGIKPSYTGTSKNAFSVCISFFCLTTYITLRPSVYFLFVFFCYNTAIKNSTNLLGLLEGQNESQLCQLYDITKKIKLVKRILEFATNTNISNSIQRKCLFKHLFDLV